MDENSDNMHILYIQKQESLLLENVRNKIDYEIKLHILNDNLNKLLEQNKQLQISLQQQQEINSQAISSFERISEENIELKNNNMIAQNKIKTLEQLNQSSKDAAGQILSSGQYGSGSGISSIDLKRKQLHSMRFS
mgnify:CR=1 FL=1